MKGKLRGAVLCTAASALALGLSLTSCSRGAPDNGAAAQNAAADETPGPTPPAQSASDANARALLKRMSDYLAAQNNIAMSYDSIFEVVSDGHEKFQIATSGTVVMERPGKIRTTRKSGFSDTEMVYDGKTLSFLGKGQNAYIQTEMAGTIDSLIDGLRDKFHRQLPGADLLQSGVYEELMTGVTEVKDLGSGVIGGVECDHLAFRAQHTDWQIWIAQGPTPYPCRYVITSKEVDQAPQFTLEVRDWKAGGAAGGGDFSFTPPAGATRMKLEDLQKLKETSDLPENYRTGATQ